MNIRRRVSTSGEEVHLRRRTVLAVLRLSDGNAAAHLAPLARSVQMERLHVVREAPARVEPSGKVVWHVSSRRGRLPPLVRLAGLGRAVLRRERLEVTVGFSLVPYGLLAWGLAKLCRVPNVLCLLGTDFDVHCHAWYGAVMRGVLRRSDVVTVPGTRMREELESWSVARERIRVLPNAIDVARFRDSPADDRRMHRMLFVGRLIPLKRVGDILRALAEVRTQVVDATLVIVGDGPERPRLERQAVELGIREAVEFAGHREDVEAYYRGSGLVLLASEREGLPFALIEGMASGCVPISTRCGSVEDVIEHGRTGYVVNVGDWQAMAARIVSLLRDRATLARMGKAVLEVRHRYSWESATRTWDDILAGLGDHGAR